MGAALLVTHLAACGAVGAREQPAEGQQARRSRESGATAAATALRMPPVKALPGLKAPPRDEEVRVTLGAVGDVLLHTEVQASAAAEADALGGNSTDGFRALFAAVADELSAPDVTFANLETPVAPRDGQVKTGGFSFNAPLEAADALRLSGVDVVSVANNHIFDRGRWGLEQTLKNLDGLQLPHVGVGLPPTEAGPRILEVKGMRIGILAWTQVLNRDFPACHGRKLRCPQVAVLKKWEPVIARVREVGPSVDALVVSLHWGTEYAPAPDEGQRTLAKLLVEAGADVVLGHHPHVLQPIETITRKDGTTAVVAYSLGNLISNQSRHYRGGRKAKAEGDPRDGVLLRIELAQAAAELGGKRSRARITGLDALPLWTVNDRGDEGPARIRTVATSRALAALTTGEEEPEDSHDRRRQNRERRLYRERVARVSERLGRAWIREPAVAEPSGSGTGDVAVTGRGH